MKLLQALCSGLALTAFIGMAFAHSIYQYRDENGVRHFSDTPPATGQPVEASEAFTPEPEKRVFIKETGSGDDPALAIVNELYGPVEVQLWFEDLTNLISTPSLPKRFVVAAGGELPAVRLQIENAGWPCHYRYRYRYILGPPGVRHAPKSPYRLPFQKGRGFKVAQAFNGSFSHNEDHSRFAVDISMPEGTPIVCARDGIVVVIEQNYVWAGLNKDYYGNKINHIRVMHDDGTMAFYGHLLRGSARVRCGDHVTAGQVIAESGNTGYSKGPHLHFVIQKNEGMRWVSIPFLFAGPDGAGLTPEKGRVLQAF